MRGQKGDPVIERERELQGLMNDPDPKIREQAKKDWYQFLEEHPERQTPIARK